MQVKFNVTMPTASFLCILCYHKFAQMMSCAMPYDIIYHPFPFNSQYLKTWGVDSPAFRYLKGPLIKFSGTKMKGVLFCQKTVHKESKGLDLIRAEPF